MDRALKYLEEPAIQTRTKDPETLKKLATAWLDKKYTRLKPTDTLPNKFYMLEPKSVNGIKEIGILPGDATYDPKTGITKIINRPVVDYRISIRNGTKEKNILDRNQELILTNDDIKWTRMFGFGTSASDVVLGGTLRKSRRNTKRRQRKSRRR
jgi:hypothetical protein